MDHADRIPIDLGYEEAAEAAVQDPRTTVREDGSLVIDILVEQPCTPATEGEIVVCAPAGDGSPYLPPPPPPPEPSVMEKVGEALHAKLGPIEVGSIPKGDGTRVFGARMRF